MSLFPLSCHVAGPAAPECCSLCHAPDGFSWADFVAVRIEGQRVHLCCEVGHWLLSQRREVEVVPVHSFEREQRVASPEESEALAQMLSHVAEHLTTAGGDKLTVTLTDSASGEAHVLWDGAAAKGEPDVPTVVNLFLSALRSAVERVGLQAGDYLRVPTGEGSSAIELRLERVPELPWRPRPAEAERFRDGRWEAWEPEEQAA